MKVMYDKKNSTASLKNGLEVLADADTNGNRWRKLWADRPFIASLVFAFLLFVLEEARFGLPQTIFMVMLPRQPIWVFLGGILSIVVNFLLLVMILWASFNSKTAYRIIYGAIFIFAILVQYNYQATFDRFISVGDLNTAFSSPFSLWLDAAALFFNWLGLLPIIVYLLLLAWTWKHQKYTGKLLLAVVVIVFGANLISYYLGYGRSAALSVSAFFKTVGNVLVEGIEVKQLERELVPYQSETRPQNNIVLIIDESVRGDRLSLNGYERPTTPYLEQLSAEGYLANWGIAVSASTCSILSNKLIIAGGTELPDLEYRLETNPTIFQYAKAMGYTTYHLDAQADYLWTGLSVGDLSYVDHRITRREFGDDYDVDLHIADFLYEQLSTSTGNFFVVNKAGVHFHYNDTYPPEATMWEPIPEDKTYVDPMAVGNTYDNGMLYNVEQFFRRLLKTTDVLENTFILYTSDHGQTLIENHETWPHCGDTLNEATIPLFLISQYDLPLDTEYEASHKNIFPTLLDLMAVPDEARVTSYPLSLLVATASDSTDRYFLGGTAEAIYSVLVNFDQPQ